MKKIIIMLAITISSLAVFAGEENVNSRVLNAFSREFSGAKDVKWTTNETYSKASFVYNGQYVYAFYQLDGELMAMTRNISSIDLPIKLQSGLKKDTKATGYRTFLKYPAAMELVIISLWRMLIKNCFEINN
jgi:hypothetical protein